jgi:hypothetical protein
MLLAVVELLVADANDFLEGESSETWKWTSWKGALVGDLVGVPWGKRVACKSSICLSLGEMVSAMIFSIDFCCWASRLSCIFAIMASNCWKRSMGVVGDAFLAAWAAQ